MQAISDNEDDHSLLSCSVHAIFPNAFTDLIIVFLTTPKNSWNLHHLEIYCNITVILLALRTLHGVQKKCEFCTIQLPKNVLHIGKFVHI